MDGNKRQTISEGAIRCSVRRCCCGRMVLFLWKRDGWGKAVVGTGHPCPCRSNAPSKQGQEQTMGSLVYI